MDVGAGIIGRTLAVAATPVDIPVNAHRAAGDLDAPEIHCPLTRDTPFGMSVRAKSGGATRSPVGLGLFGGWPGALLGQRVFRHKTKKAEFQFVFWVSVLVNCGAFVWLLTDEGADYLRTLIG